jgi:uncharacterized protein YkwD
VIFDTGADLNHLDLRPKYLGGKDYVDGGNPDDMMGHGTHVTGIAAAATNDGRGIPGTGFDTRFVMVRVLDANGSGDIFTIANALVDLANTAVTMPGWRFVVNFSLGCQCTTRQMSDAVAYAHERGLLLVAAAGNSASDLHFEPAAIPQVLGVGSVDRLGVKAGSSNYGPNAKVVAPGVGILSTCRGNAYCTLSGTSMASPQVAGIAALVWSVHPTWTNEQVKTALLRTARPLGDAYTYGAGIVQAAEAVQFSGAAPTPGPTPTLVDYPHPTPSEQAAELERLVKLERDNRGLEPVTHSNPLALASQRHNEWENLYNCFAHQCPGEADPFTRMREAGFPQLVSGSEVIGHGYANPRAMLTGWLNSPPHNAIILAPSSWPSFGCHVLDAANGYYLGLYYTCDFARSGSGKVEEPVLSGPLESHP